MKYILLTLLIAAHFTINAQNQEENANIIDIQFKELLDESNNFKEFKVIKQTDINRLRKTTNEHIEKLNDNITSLETSIKTKDLRITAIEKDLSGSKAQLNEVNEKKDSMYFLGVQTSKSIYNTVLWTIVGILAFLFVFMSLRYKNSNVVTKAANKQLATTEEELEELRRKSIEKEQKLGRQLLDERNKLSKLKGDK